MTAAYRGGQQGDRLLRESLADLEPLRRRQRHIARTKLLGLFAVYLSPLLLVTD
jgi:hypothetical protein